MLNTCSTLLSRHMWRFYFLAPAIGIRPMNCKWKAALHCWAEHLITGWVTPIVFFPLHNHETGTDRRSFFRLGLPIWGWPRKDRLVIRSMNKKESGVVLRCCLGPTGWGPNSIWLVLFKEEVIPGRGTQRKGYLRTMREHIYLQAKERRLRRNQTCLWLNLGFSSLQSCGK